MDGIIKIYPSWIYFIVSIDTNGLVTSSYYLEISSVYNKVIGYTTDIIQNALI